MKKHTIDEKQEFVRDENLIYTETNCPVRITMKIIGGKWKIILIHIIHNEAPIRFGALRRKTDGITQSMLTAVLRELEEDGIIHRQIYAEVPPRVEYTLTELGRSLLPIIQSTIDWGLAKKARDRQL